MPIGIGPQALRRRRIRPSQLRGSGWPVFNPPVGLSIAGTDYTALVKAHSPQIRNTIAPYAGIFTFILTGTYSQGSPGLLGAVAVEQEVTWNDGVGVVYAGRVRIVTPQDVDRLDYLELRVECQDFTTLLNDDICAFAVSAPAVDPNRTVIESDAQRIQWLLNSFGRHSVTTHRVLTNYATVPATDYSGQTLTQAITSVAAYSASQFYVDYTKDLHYFTDEKIYAPFVLNDAASANQPAPIFGLVKYGTPNVYGSGAANFKNLLYPADSITMRNAVYGLPPATVVIDSATEAVTTAQTLSNTQAVLASFRPALGAAITLVGALGAFLSNNAASVSPLFGQPTTAGNLLVAWVSPSIDEATTAAAGWVKAVSLVIQRSSASIWYKPNCGAAETAPVFTVAGAATMRAQLAEFKGADLVSPLDQSGSAANGVNGPLTITASNAAIDSRFGSLVLMAVTWDFQGGGATAAFQDTFNNRMVTVQAGNTAATVTIFHTSFSYGIIPGIPGQALPTWYMNDASIALYGRREAAFKTSAPTTQGDLDALGAAYLTNNAIPQKQSSVTCWRPGLQAGSRVTVSSSLYTIPVIIDPLGNYSGIIQSVTINYPLDNYPEFTIQFLQPTSTLAVQIGNVVASIPAAVVLPTLGALGYAQATANQTGIAAVVDIAGLVLTVTVGAGRRLRISTFVAGQQQTTVADPVVQIQEGATILQQSSFQVQPGQNVAFTPTVVLTPSAGAHTYKLTAQSGAGTLSIFASATQPAYILVEDIGT